MLRPLSVCALPLVVGCATTPHQPQLNASDASATLSRTRDEGTAQQGLSPLTFPEVMQKAPPESTVPVRFIATRAYLDRTIERYVPTVVHEERGRELGNGTKLNLRVTRGRPTYALVGPSLELEVPLQLSIQVQQRLGPIDLDLGQCSPHVVAKASLVTSLNSDLSPELPRLQLRLTETCQLAVLDVSPMIVQELERQQARALREAQAHIKTVAVVLGSQVAQFEKSLDERDPSCPRLEVKRVLQGPLSEARETLFSYLAVQGVLTKDCGTVRTVSPTVIKSTAAPLFDVAEASSLSWETLSRAIDPILRKANLSSQPLVWRSAQTPQGERIALGLAGPSGVGWVFLTPEVRGQTLRLSVRESDNEALKSRVQTSLLEVTLPLDTTQAQAHASQLWEKSQRLSFIQLEKPSVMPSFETSAEASVEPLGLRVVVHVKAGNLSF